MFISLELPEILKRSASNEELETLSTCDLYGVSDKAGAGNPPAFLCPPGLHILRLSDSITFYEALSHLKPRFFKSIGTILSLQRPLSITDATFTKPQNLQNLAGTVCPASESTNPKKQ